MGDVTPFDVAKRRAAEKQREVDGTLSVPDTLEAAKEISTPITTEDGARTLGVGLFPPPEGKAWLLTPEQADALALELVRDANKVRKRWEDGR